MSKALVEGKYFRVCPITRIIDIGENGPITEEKPIYCGLGIEQRQNKHYCVVAYVRPGVNGGVDLCNVGFRPVNMIDESMPMEDFWEMMQEYKNCVDFAADTVADEFIRRKDND